MATRRRKSPEQIVRLLGQADQLLANGEDLASVCRTLGISESSFHRWRARYGGMNVDDAKRLKELEAENYVQKVPVEGAASLDRAPEVAAALKEIAKGKW